MNALCREICWEVLWRRLPRFPTFPNSPHRGEWEREREPEISRQPMGKREKEKNAVGKWSRWPDMIQITLPWPPKQLSPNGRLHWAVKNKYRKLYRDACYWQARQVNARAVVGPLEVSLEFYPPDRRHRDWDNMLASIKSGLDGVAEAIGCDDKHWRLSMSVNEKIGGYIKCSVGV